MKSTGESPRPRTARGNPEPEIRWRVHGVEISKFKGSGVQSPMGVTKSKFKELSNFRVGFLGRGDTPCVQNTGSWGYPTKRNWVIRHLKYRFHLFKERNFFRGGDQFRSGYHPTTLFSTAYLRTRTLRTSWRPNLQGNQKPTKLLKKSSQKFVRPSAWNRPRDLFHSLYIYHLSLLSLFLSLFSISFFLLSF